jgi:hypothetical protein
MLVQMHMHTYKRVSSGADDRLKNDDADAMSACTIETNNINAHMHGVHRTVLLAHISSCREGMSEPR